MNASKVILKTTNTGGQQTTGFATFQEEFAQLTQTCDLDLALTVRDSPQDVKLLRNKGYRTDPRYQKTTGFEIDSIPDFDKKSNEEIGLLGDAEKATYTASLLQHRTLENVILSGNGLKQRSLLACETNNRILAGCYNRLMEQT